MGEVGRRGERRNREGKRGGMRDGEMVGRRGGGRRRGGKRERGKEERGREGESLKL